MSGKIAARTGFKFTMSVAEGSEKGSFFQLLPPKVTIGRDPENNIVLTDPRVSRNALIIEFSMEQILAKDLSSRGGLIVNGELAREASLRNGDIIQLGDTKLVFKVESIPLSPTGAPQVGKANLALQAMDPKGLPPYPSAPSPSYPSPSFPSAPPPRTNRRPRSRPSGGNRMNFYIVVAVILGGFFWMVNSPIKEPKEETHIPSVEDIENTIKEATTRTEESVKKRTFKSDEEKTRYEEAQRHYLEGFRDYQKAQYMRAMKSFETARAIDPSHELAKRYFRLAEKHRDEMIASLTLEGRQYREKAMYSRCSSAFEKVLDAIPNKEDLKYKQAEALKKECDELMEERFN